MKYSNFELISKFVTITSLPFSFDVDMLNVSLLLNDDNWKKSVIYYSYDIDKNPHMSLSDNKLSFILDKELSIEGYMELDNILWNIMALYLHKISKTFNKRT